MIFVLFSLLSISMFIDYIHSKKYILHTNYLDCLRRNNKGYIFYSKYILVGIIFLFNINIFYFIVLVFYLWDMLDKVKNLKQLQNLPEFNERTIWYEDKNHVFSFDLVIDLAYLSMLFFFYSSS